MTDLSRPYVQRRRENGLSRQIPIGAKAEYCYQSYKKTGRPTGEVRCQRQVGLTQPASVIRNLRIKSERGKNKIRSWRKRTCCTAENGIKFCKRWRFFVPKCTVLSFLARISGLARTFCTQKVRGRSLRRQA